MTAQFEKWMRYTIDGVASVELPEGTKATVEDDETMVVLSLPGDPETAILMGLFPLEDGDVVSDQTVQDGLTDFIERCVRGAQPLSFVSIEPAAEIDDASLCVWQAVARTEADVNHWWLARIYGWRGASDILLVHWNGPGAQMQRVVIQSFASLEPLFQ